MYNIVYGEYLINHANIVLDKRNIRIAVFVMPPKELWEAYSNRTVHPSVRPASCPVHISYILWGRNSKFGVWIHLGMAECRVQFLGHCDPDLDLWPSF